MASTFRPGSLGEGDDRPLAFFAGLWVPQWTSVQKVKEGEVTTDIFAVLTTEPNAVVAPIHPKAMPVILTEPDEFEAWMAAPWAEASALQRPLADGLLRIVEHGRADQPREEDLPGGDVQPRPAQWSPAEEL